MSIDSFGFDACKASRASRSTPAADAQTAIENHHVMASGAIQSYLAGYAASDWTALSLSRLNPYNEDITTASWMGPKLFSHSMAPPQHDIPIRGLCCSAIQGSIQEPARPCKHRRTMDETFAFDFRRASAWNFAEGRGATTSPVWKHLGLAQAVCRFSGRRICKVTCNTLEMWTTMASSRSAYAHLQLPWALLPSQHPPGRATAWRSWPSQGESYGEGCVQQAPSGVGQGCLGGASGAA